MPTLEDVKEELYRHSGDAIEVTVELEIGESSDGAPITDEVVISYWSEFLNNDEEDENDIDEENIIERYNENTLIVTNVPADKIINIIEIHH